MLRLTAIALCLATPALADLRQTGLEVVTGWVSIISSADEEKIARTLAPEYQIQRAGGVGYDRDAYLAHGLPTISSDTPPRVEIVEVTGDEDLMVVRWALTIDATVEGGHITRQAPRLTVFRRENEKWMAVAHANFAVPE